MIELILEVNEDHNKYHYQI